MKFIKLTRINDERNVWIERSKIESVESSDPAYKDSVHTIVTTSSKDMFEVKELPHEIFYKMNTFEDDCDIYEN